MELERRILHLLENNARLSCKAIATMLDEDEARIKSIIEQMEKQKIILGYNTIINWELLGNDGVTAMIDVKVTPEREVGFNSVAEKIYRYPEVRCVYLMSGTYDLSVVVNGESMKDIAWFVSHKLSTLDHVQSTVTHFILKRYKQENFIFEEPEEDRRLVVSP
ncbi:Lrp/AsnC family transcriptional regulator [Syntrophomonas wolfei]|uniref:Transcriptional regulator, AsnC family n=1 Tax=Syntrophomonas wolfei subsp. wolfei (strain DSM 2245B / Goettingen) TaxID=335541 RepID=Q0AXN9_SYNWW|nr:Lrp/AsnC family transcriptional regulator [Syntrophomonas wolfei]ABI68515.1 transcriptional regulator, AsnC family [Syntrophomonas wolfei subsp. wolfei str. Goettingen G311]